MALQVAEMSVQMIESLRPLIGRIRARDKSLADQLTRAASSVCLNIAESQHSDPGNWRARLFTAAGSASESLMAVRVAVAWGYVNASEGKASAALLDRILAFALELERHVEPEADTHSAVCLCVAQLAGTLKPEYADALRRVEIDGMAVMVMDYASEAGITSNNAAVRVFRARQALRKQLHRSCGPCAEHGCLDCTCENSSGHSA